MPVTKSAKRALRVAHRRHEENLLGKAAYKKTLKAVRKAAEAGSEKAVKMFSEAQSALDTAAKNHTIHRNKAARLKARLAKKIGMGEHKAAAPARTKAKKAAPKKKTAAKKK